MGISAVEQACLGGEERCDGAGAGLRRGRMMGDMWDKHVGDGTGRNDAEKVGSLDLRSDLICLIFMFVFYLIGRALLKKSWKTITINRNYLQVTKEISWL